MSGMGGIDEPGAAMVYEGYLEVRPDGACLAQLSDLQGCFAYGRSQHEALDALALSIPGYYDWLRTHDEYSPTVRGQFRVTAREVVPVPTLGGHAGGAFFAPDAVPVSEEDLDWSLALLDWSYQDLNALLARLPPEAVRAPLPAGQTLGDALDHVPQTQIWLISRLEAQPVVPLMSHLPGTALDHLRQVWQATLSRLRTTNEEERQRMLEHDGERWSLRKVLRRSVLHVREHSVELAQITG